MSDLEEVNTPGPEEEPEELDKQSNQDQEDTQQQQEEPSQPNVDYLGLKDQFLNAKINPNSQLGKLQKLGKDAEENFNKKLNSLIKNNKPDKGVKNIHSGENAVKNEAATTAKEA